MGTRIQSTDIASERSSGCGSVDLEVAAAKRCLAKAEVDPRSLGILINTGVYRDRHVFEPAISSFIQKKIGGNEEFDGALSTLSFDLMNGGCGAVTGMMVADGFLQSGLTRYAMVVSGDAEPVPGASNGYGFSPAAAAVLLTPGGDDEGFFAFESDSDTRYLESFRARLEWTRDGDPGARLVLQSDAAYADQCAGCAVRSLETLLVNAGLTLGDVDLLLPSQSPRGFVTEVSKRTGLGDSVVDVTGEYGDVHTAGVGMALHTAIADGRFKSSRHVVFLGVGAGVTTALALYRNPL